MWPVILTLSLIQPFLTVPLSVFINITIYNEAKHVYLQTWRYVDITHYVLINVNEILTANKDHLYRQVDLCLHHRDSPFLVPQQAVVYALCVVTMANQALISLYNNKKTT